MPVVQPDIEDYPFIIRFKTISALSKVPDSNLYIEDYPFIIRFKTLLSSWSSISEFQY